MTVLYNHLLYIHLGDTKMKILINAIMCFSLLFAIYSNSIAGELAYTCKVMHTYKLNDDSSLKRSNLDKQFKGSKFSVSRITGEIIGEVLPTLLADSTKVIHKGNEEYSFKAIANFKNQIQLIEVKEFLQGERKPFVAMSMGGAGIASGVCR